MLERPTKPLPLLSLHYDDLILLSLREDLGTAGDLTTDAIVSRHDRARAEVVARQDGHVAGLEASLSAFRQLDPQVETRMLAPDGSSVQGGTALAVVEGGARALLSAERTALNLLGRLSGIATSTAALVEAVQSYPAQVVCTRKTTPGLRALEKYAVRCGGGRNHRFGLDDAVLIKDNHLVVAGGVSEAVARVKHVVGHMVKIEVEVDTLQQLEEALALSVDAVLLDNMRGESLIRAIEMAKGRALVEVSGGLNLESAREAAAAGADLLSVGRLTHSSPALDVGFDFSPLAAA